MILDFLARSSFFWYFLARLIAKILARILRNPRSWQEIQDCPRSWQKNQDAEHWAAKRTYSSVIKDPKCCLRKNFGQRAFLLLTEKQLKITMLGRNKIRK